MPKKNNARKGRYDVYGIGNALVDIVIEVDDEFFAHNRVEKGVMTLVDERRQEELMRSIEIKSSTTAAGGSAANTVVGLSQLGGKGAYSFVVARDELGKIFIEDMRRNGVAIDVEHDDFEQGHSGRCLVMVSPDAERTMNTFLGQSALFSPKEVSETLVREATYVYLEGYLVSTPEGTEAMLKAKNIADKYGVKTALTLSDPNMVKFFSQRFEKVIGDGVDLLFCNEQEARIYTQSDTLDEACRRLQKAARAFVVTRGAKGSVVYNGERYLDIPPHAIPHAVDTNGAGDMFAAGFLYGVTHGFSYADSAQVASVMAAHVVSQVGPRLSDERIQEALREVEKITFQKI